MAEVVEEENNVVVEGTVVGFEVRELRTGAVMLTIKLSDDTEGSLPRSASANGTKATTPRRTRRSVRTSRPRSRKDPW